MQVISRGDDEHPKAKMRSMGSKKHLAVIARRGASCGARGIDWPN